VPLVAEARAHADCVGSEEQRYHQNSGNFGKGGERGLFGEPSENVPEDEYHTRNKQYAYDNNSCESHDLKF
jgi:hypothetical protein